jgi:hypothetical protein
MWIRSQNKEVLIDATAIQLHQFDDLGLQVEECSIYGYAGESGFLLGKYSNKKAAIDVLDDIETHLNKIHYVFQMPEELED